MTLKFNTLTMKNFLSIGAVTQTLELNCEDLTLVLGTNLDLGGADSRNGVGKSSIVNALFYALFGQSLGNIKKDNLINLTNNKNMLVTLDFESRGIQYRIERGRRPNVTKLFVAGEEQKLEDSSQGDSRETQLDLEKLLSLTPDLFRHIVTLNTYTEPFLSMRAADQRTVIEQLLGITQLSEKSERLKEEIRTVKSLISQEEIMIRAEIEANQRLQEQITNLERRQTLWHQQREKSQLDLATQLAELENIDVDQEVQNHAKLEQYNKVKAEQQQFNQELGQLEKNLARERLNLKKIQTEIQELEKNKCHSCGQKLSSHQHKNMLTEKLEVQNVLIQDCDQLEKDIVLLKTHISGLPVLEKAPVTHYKTLTEALNHKNTMQNIEQKLMDLESQSDPYADQISEMQTSAIKEVDYGKLNDLKRVQDHQEFLLKILTNKDSFVRKRIIDQNLGYLNTRLSYYLDALGLPHTVTFQNDLTVDISELGRELSFDNLSRGERNRLILSLSWAFRDVWENAQQKINLLFVDELLDSGLDSLGVNLALGVLKSMSRDQDRSVFLVSHRDELSSRVNSVLNVIKENGFTQISTEQQI
jgi:DNA repair exonuclease SbcCD ATPase subunit